MAVTVDATSGSSGAAGTTLTFSHTVGDGISRVLVVLIALGASGAFPSEVTYNGRPMVNLGGVGTTNNPLLVDGWYLVDPPKGTHDIIVTKASGVAIAASAISVFGGDKPDYSNGQAADTQTASSLSITASRAGLIADIISTSANPPTANGSQTAFQAHANFTGTQDQSSSYKSVSAGSPTMDWTFSSTDYAHGGVFIPEHETTIAVDDVTEGTAETGTSITVSHTISNNDHRVLLVNVSSTDGVGTPSVAYNGASMTLLASSNVASKMASWTFGLQDPDVGTHNIVVTKDNGTSYGVSAISFVGADSPNATASAEQNTAGATGTISLTVTTNGTGNGYVFVAGARNTTGNPLSYSGSGIEISDFDHISSQRQFAARTNYASGGNITESWSTIASQKWAAVGIEVPEFTVTEYTVTVTAKARIKLPTSKTVTAKARMEVIGNTKTLTAKGKIKVAGNDKTVTARAKIGLVQTQTVDAKANIFNTAEKTVDAKARVLQPNNTESIDARARIFVVQDEEIQAKARMKVVQTKTLQAKARVAILATSVTVTAKARVKQAGVTGTITAMARILKVQTQTLTAKARMWAARLNVKVGRRADGAQAGVRFVRHG